MDQDMYRELTKEAARNFTHYCCFLSVSFQLWQSSFWDWRVPWASLPYRWTGTCTKSWPRRPPGTPLIIVVSFPFLPSHYRAVLEGEESHWLLCPTDGPGHVQRADQGDRQELHSLLLFPFRFFPAITEQFWRVKSPIGFSALQMDQDMYKELTKETARNFTHYFCFLYSHDRAVLDSEESHGLLCPTDGPGYVQRADEGDGQELHSLLLFLFSHDRAVLEGEESHGLLCLTDGPGYVQRADQGDRQERPAGPGTAYTGTHIVNPISELIPSQDYFLFVVWC